MHRSSATPEPVSAQQPLSVLLIGNYAPDRQQSMQRFAEQIAAHVSSPEIHIRTLLPGVFFGLLRRGNKWLGYLDKYLVFPLRLWAITHLPGRPSLVHIADHSNAMYSAFCGSLPVVVTVHDMLAVRAGLGEEGTGCRSSRLGTCLQKWIISGLRRARQLAAVSATTQNDVTRLIAPAHPALLIPNAVGAAFIRLPPVDAEASLKSLPQPPPSAPYLFHVGSSLPRKNRLNIIRIFEKLRREGWDGALVFAGKGLDADVAAAVAASPFARDIHFVGSVTEPQLVALYNRAHCLVFPSYSEGFGWPLIEAGACGCPFVTSNTTSLPEVCGTGGQTFAPDDVEGMARAIRALDDLAHRARWAEAAQANAARYTLAHLAATFRDLYRRLAGEAAHAAP